MENTGFVIKFYIIYKGIKFQMIIENSDAQKARNLDLIPLKVICKDL